jgi:hypothetical protein
VVFKGQPEVSPEKIIADRLATPEFAHYCKPLSPAEQLAERARAAILSTAKADADARRSGYLPNYPGGCVPSHGAVERRP